MTANVTNTVTQEELGYWLALIRFPKFGPTRMGQLRKKFATMKEAFYASAPDILACEIPEEVVTEFIATRGTLSPERELKLMETHQITALPIIHPQYPGQLKTINDPPPVLFYKGTLPKGTETMLAVVGSREPSDYGKRIVAEWIPALAKEKITIVSGLAVGIDGAAHQRTLEAGGKTLAVLGGGLERSALYPAVHRGLADQILATGGALFSERLPQTHYMPYHFPARNRIIAGLCRAVLIVEARVKSGTLHTAQAALENGRDILVPPGSIFEPTCEGLNNLIKTGALTVTNVSDILQALSLPTTENILAKRQAFVPDTPDEKILYPFLRSTPLHIDELTSESHLTPAVVARTLTLLEMKGGARHVGGWYYIQQ